MCIYLYLCLYLYLYIYICGWNQSKTQMILKNNSKKNTSMFDAEADKHLSRMCCGRILTSQAVAQMGKGREDLKQSVQVAAQTWWTLPFPNENYGFLQIFLLVQPNQCWTAVDRSHLFHQNKRLMRCAHWTQMPCLSFSWSKRSGNDASAKTLAAACVHGCKWIFIPPRIAWKVIGHEPS